MIPAIINSAPAMLCTLSSVFTVSFLRIQCALWTLIISAMINVTSIDQRNTRIMAGDIWLWCLRIKWDNTVTQNTKIDGLTIFIKNHFAASVRFPICHMDVCVSISTSFVVSFFKSNITQYTQKTIAPMTHIIWEGHQSQWRHKINHL